MSNKHIVPCTYCGTPIHGISTAHAKEEPIYCCSGCLFADSLTQSLKQDRLKLWMVAALGTIFAIFNQILFFLLGRKWTGEEVSAGPTLVVISILLGAVAWGVATGAAWKRREKGLLPTPLTFGGTTFLFLFAFVVALLVPVWAIPMAGYGIWASLLLVASTFLVGWVRRPRGKK